MLWLPLIRGKISIAECMQLSSTV